MRAWAVTNLKYGPKSDRRNRRKPAVPVTPIQAGRPSERDKLKRAHVSK